MEFDGKNKKNDTFNCDYVAPFVMLIFFFIAIRKRAHRVRARTPAPAFNSMTFVCAVPFLFSLRSVHIKKKSSAFFLLRLYFHLLLILIHSLIFCSIANFHSRLIHLGRCTSTYILYLMERELFASVVYFSLVCQEIWCYASRKICTSYHWGVGVSASFHWFVIFVAFFSLCRLQFFSPFPRYPFNLRLCQRGTKWRFAQFSLDCITADSIGRKVERILNIE